MSRWLPEVLKPASAAIVGLDTDAAAWRPATAMVTEPAPQAPDALAVSLPHRPWHLVAGLDLAVHWLQTPPPGLRSLAELRQVAAARCAQLHGGLPEDWWIAADWSAHHDFVCAALPLRTLAPWRAAARARRVRLRIVTVWSAACAARQRSLPTHGWSALTTPSQVIVWHCTEGRVDCLLGFHGTQATSGTMAAQRTAQHIRLACVRHAHLTEEPVRWLALPPHAAPVTEAAAALCWGELATGATA